MQFLQIVLPKFNFTELGSKSEILLKNKMHNFYRCQKEYPRGDAGGLSR